MALCPHCEAEIFDDAELCLSCGRPTRAALVIADFWTRAGGLVIDWLVVGIASFAFNANRGAWFGSLILGFLYHWLLVAYWNGQTLGKRALNIRVARPDGSAVDPSTAATRSAMRIVSGLPLGLGFVWAAWDGQRRTWHDMVADTRVYRVA